MLTFRLINGKKVSITKEKLNQIITTKLSSNPYWMYNGMLDPQEVQNFFSFMLGKATINPKTLNKIAYYILFWAENSVLTVYLYTQSEQYLENHMPLLKILRQKYDEILKTDNIERKKELINQMLEKCLSYCIDP
ncbi:hypothetical protein, partial [Thermococcus sp.]